MAFLMSDVIMYFLISLIGMVIVLLIGHFAYDVDFSGNPLLFLYGFVLSTLSTFSIGLLISSLCKNAKIAQTVGMVVGFPMMFLSGSCIPVEFMPDKMDKVAQFMPLSYSVSMMRDIWENAKFGDLVNDSLVLAGVAVVFTVLTALTFKWD